MLVYIKPLSTFPKLHSDTLFGAITSAINDLYPNKVEDMLNEFENSNPPFLISSTFPVIFKDDEKIKFYPKIILGDDFTDMDTKIIKDYKKVKYIEERLFRLLIDGKISHRDILKDYDKYQRFSNLLFSRKIDADIGFDENITPNNSVNRLFNQTNIFYTQGDSYYNMGLYFLCKIYDDEYDDILKASLKFLKDRGFGRDISTGKGHFDYEIRDYSFLEDNTQKNMFTTLSRFTPTVDDLKSVDANSFYEISSKRGRDKSGEIRKQIRFFSEGSVFANSKKFYGQLIRSGTKAVEYAYAFPVRFNVKGD